MKTNEQEARDRVVSAAGDPQDRATRLRLIDENGTGERLILTYPRGEYNDEMEVIATTEGLEVECKVIPWDWILRQLACVLSQHGH